MRPNLSLPPRPGGRPDDKPQSIPPQKPLIDPTAPKVPGLPTKPAYTNLPVARDFGTAVQKRKRVGSAAMQVNAEEPEQHSEPEHEHTQFLAQNLESFTISDKTDRISVLESENAALRAELDSAKKVIDARRQQMAREQEAAAKSIKAYSEQTHKAKEISAEATALNEALTNKVALLQNDLATTKARLSQMESQRNAQVLQMENDSHAAKVNAALVDCLEKELAAEKDRAAELTKRIRELEYKASFFGVIVRRLSEKLPNTYPDKWDVAAGIIEQLEEEMNHDELYQEKE